MTLTVFKGDGKRPEDVTGEMAERIRAVIYEYAESHKLPLAAAIGVLHIVAAEIMTEQTQ